MVMIQTAHVLRVSARSAGFSCSKPPHIQLTRQLWTLDVLHRRAFTPLNLRAPQTTTLPHLGPCSRRLLSLGSIFTRPKPTATPSPLVVAHITKLEAEANVHPHDVSKQLALFQALVDTKLPSSYEVVISRWERMCEFVSSPPVSFLFPAGLNVSIQTGL